MKHLKEFIKEGEEFNLSLNSHKQIYNSFIKWYDKYVNKMSKEEMLDMLKTIIAEIEDDSLDFAK